VGFYQEPSFLVICLLLVLVGFLTSFLTLSLSFASLFSCSQESV
jgi:hypothetical protein